MVSPLAALGVRTPVLAAPMAGGPARPRWSPPPPGPAAWASSPPGTGPPRRWPSRSPPSGRGVPFGVNLFAPNPVPVDPARVPPYAGRSRPRPDRYGIALAGGARSRTTTDLARQARRAARRTRSPVVSFTFGIPPAADLAALRADRRRARPDRDLGRRGQGRRRGAGWTRWSCSPPPRAGTPARSPRAHPVPEVPLPDLVAAGPARRWTCRSSPPAASAPRPTWPPRCAPERPRSPSAPSCCAAPRPARRRPTGPRWPTRPAPAHGP